MAAYHKEGASNTRPPLLDGTNYAYWISKMKTYIKAQDERAWRSVEDGWEPLTVEAGKDADVKRVVKPSSKWNDAEEKLANCNSKALNAIFGGIDEEQFRRVSACTTAKEAWKILEVHYEGTESVRAIKLQMLMTRFELMRMRDDETILEFEGKIRDIANQSANLGDRIPQDQLVKKVLRSLSSKFKMKRIAIEENRPLNDMTLDELIGSLKTFEMNEESSDSVREVKKNSVALQTLACNEVTQSTQESDIPTITLAELDAKVSFLFKGFNKFIRESKKKNWSSREGKLRGGSFDSATKNKSITCYECGGRGHIQTECPTYLKKEKSRLWLLGVPTSTSEDEECSDDETDDEDDICTSLSIIKQWDGVLESINVLKEQVVVLEREKVVLKQKLDEKEEEARESERKEGLLRYQNCTLSEENHLLKQKINEKEERILKLEEELRKAKEIWVKFDKGKQQLDDILTQEKRMGSKHGLGYSGASSSLQPARTQPRYEQVRRFIPTCHFCGVYGHIRPYCYKLQRVRRRNENLKGVKSSAQNLVWMKKDISLFAAHTAEKTNTDGIWYFDSGCSRHMTGSIEFLTNLQKETGGQVTFGDGEKDL
ncbi:hypothetical protein H6P81_010334 [Aristolochia fimbriata]|uniref:CCHC-type domain-containing protein n=1 Tax=Aristolochia fimbriata TaxID=158543 RepID=A0AAV7EPN9_ARIFI|nr:hypothetical protein H6P81_010334 [Aristolochia fimbriata]